MEIVKANHPETKTTCAYCGVGCGISVSVLSDENRKIIVKGDQSHPSNLGKLCSKGSSLDETVGPATRLLNPVIDGKEVSWETVNDTIASRFQHIICEHGADAIGFYLSGQLLTEDYYVANKFAKGFLGTANIDTNSRLCMSSSVAGYKRAFGEDTVPTCYDDIEHSDLITLVGSNTAWCHPIVFQRIKRAKELNPALKVVVIDPRRTDACDIADLHLPLKPGTDTSLYSILFTYLNEHALLDDAYIAEHTQNLQQTLKVALEHTPTIEHAATLCGLSTQQIKAFCHLFAASDKPLTLFSQGVNQSTYGTDKVNAITNCHLATGKMGKPGMGAFSITGQPNAMGGREVGGLSNQLAGHMDFTPDDIARVGRFWNAPNIATQPGLKTIELFEAARAGKIKALWIMATNPVVSLPNADLVKEALQRCELVIVSDCVANTDTLDLAHIKLPAQGWGEKDGTVTNSERRISRQRNFLSPLGAAKPDWKIVADVACKMGFSAAFSYKNAAAVFREHAQLSGYENDEEQSFRLFNISQLGALTDSEYDNLNPMQWPITREKPQGTDRLFENGFFCTASKKANFVAVEYKKPAHQLDKHYPLCLNTGRIRDQWHTMTRSALAPRLNAHKPEPFIEIHPTTASQFNVTANTIVKVKSRWGEMLARANITTTIAQDQVFVPMHWNDQFASKGRIGPVVNPDTDPVSGQPELKHTPVNIQPANFNWYGLCYSRKPIPLSVATYAIKIPAQNVYRYELAGLEELSSWEHWLSRMENAEFESQPSIEYSDFGNGIFRWALFNNDKLEFCLFVQLTPIDLDRPWLTKLFEQEALSSNQRAALLSGKTPPDVEDTGQIICACFSVGAKTIQKAVSNGCRNTIEIGEATRAGTNCGSCIPEIRTLTGC